MDVFLGPGHGRPALDVGCGDGGLARDLHHRMGYRVTAIDCAPSAIARARATGGHGAGPRYLLRDITDGDAGELPVPAYAVVTCRLVFKFLPDKADFISRVRQLLEPGGVLWVVTELAERRQGREATLGITTEEIETLTAGWRVVQEADLDVLRCYALRV